MAKHKRICVCCGQTYEYCSQCDAYKNQPLWKYTFDKIECVKTFEILTAYGMNQITKEKAKELLDAINVKPEDVKNPASREQMDEIFKEEEIAINEQKAEEVTEEPVTLAVEEPVEEIVTQEVEEQPVNKTSSKRRRKKNSITNN